MPGDTWRARHDMVKTAINSLCLWAKLPANCEVFGLFVDVIPVEALREDQELQRGRKRQGLVPDFRLLLPSPTGGPTSTLAELKCLCAGASRYPRGGRGQRGVARRARLLPGEYRAALKKTRMVRWGPW